MNSNKETCPKSSKGCLRPFRWLEFWNDCEETWHLQMPGSCKKNLQHIKFLSGILIKKQAAGICKCHVPLVKLQNSNHLKGLKWPLELLKFQPHYFLVYGYSKDPQTRIPWIPTKKEAFSSHEKYSAQTKPLEHNQQKLVNVTVTHAQFPWTGEVKLQK